MTAPSTPACAVTWERQSRIIRQIHSPPDGSCEIFAQLRKGANLDEMLHRIAWAAHASDASTSAIPHTTLTVDETDEVYHVLSYPCDDPACVRTIFQTAHPQKTPGKPDASRVAELIAFMEETDDIPLGSTSNFVLALGDQLKAFMGSKTIWVLSEARRNMRGGSQTGLLSLLTSSNKEVPSLTDPAYELIGNLCGDSNLNIGIHSRALGRDHLLGFSLLTESTRFLFLLGRGEERWTDLECLQASGMVSALQLILDHGLSIRRVENTTSLLENALKAMDDGALLLRFVDGRGIITQVNEAFLKTFELQLDEVIGSSGRTVIELMRPRLPESSSVNSLLQLVQEQADEQSLEISLAGEVESIQRVNSSPCYNHDRQVVARILYFHDITRDKEIENQLLHSQKMESIGTLAGGVAHDFNNLLTTMLGNAELLKREVSDSESAQKKIAQIEKSGRRAAELTGSLLAFSRRNPTILRVIRLNEIIEETLSILRSSIPATIEIKLKLDEDLPFIEADPTQLEQVLINLALNARDAVGDPGKIVIATYASKDPQSVHDPDAPLYSVLEVADNGAGIAQENLHRVFEPFYTTKEVGKGTGLGLAMVYGIVKKHGGFIEVKSAPGMGSRFSTFIPVTSKRPTDYVAGETDGSKALGRKNYSILIVDDEPDLRTFCLAALDDYCERLETAENGLEALRIFEADPHAFDLILLDLTMPRMGGADCYRQLSELNPAVRVLISSGYSLNEDGKNLITHGAVGFLPKPYSVDQLLNAVAKALKSTPNVKRSGPKSATNDSSDQTASNTATIQEQPEKVRAEPPSSMIFGSKQ